MSVASDIKTLMRMALGGGRGGTHAECMENFYRTQADSYDDFRERLLHGRKELYQMLPTPPNGIWVEMGGGTGANLEALGNRIQKLKQIYIVDLCPSLLDVARQRVLRNNWSNVTVVEADATSFRPDEGHAHVVTFSYSLTMIPEWSLAIDQAYSLLKEGGRIGVVDYFTTPGSWSLPLACHSRLSRLFWPRWFAWASVMLNAQHPQTLSERFTVEHLAAFHGPLPYLRCIRTPYYQFIGKK